MKRPIGEDLFYQYEGEIIAEHVETGAKLICLEGDKKIGMRSFLENDIQIIATKTRMLPEDVEMLENKLKTKNSEKKYFVLQELEIAEKGTDDRMIIGIAELKFNLLTEKEFSALFFVPKELSEGARKLAEQTLLGRIVSVIQKYYELTNLSARLEIKSIGV